LKFVNQRTIEVSGYSKEELLSRPFLEFIHPDDRAMIATNYQRWMHGEHLGVFTFRLIRGNDEVLIVEIRAVPILWDGEMATLNLITDITDRKKAENALRVNQEILAEAMDLAHLVNWEYDVQNGIFAFDDRFYALYGTTVDREGGYFMLAATYFREFVHSDDRDRIIREIEKAKGISDLHYVWQSEHRIIRRDGGIRHIIVRSQKITNDDGYIIKIRGVNQDITEQKRAENEISFKNILLLTQQETSLDGILIVDENAKIINFNRKFIEIWGIPEDLIVSRIDKPVLQFATGQLVDPEMFLARVRYLYDHKDEKSFEELLLKDGRILERFSAPMVGEGGKYYGRVWYFRDITDRRRGEEALRISTEYYRTVFETTGNATVVIDNDATINLANSEFVRLSGFSKEEIERKKKWTEFVVKEDLDRMLAQHRLRRTDRDSPLKQYEFRFVTRSGEIRDIYATIDIIPGTTKSVASLLDITEHKKAEKALESAKKGIRV
jgi:PAS domain S-box-containing protein